MTISSMTAIERRLTKTERRLHARVRGVHRYTDDELSGLIAWLREPDPEDEAWAVALLQREALLS